MAIADKYSTQHERIKNNIKNSYMADKDNFARFHKMRNFVFNTSLTEEQKDYLKELGKPIVEFNIADAYLSRLIGEFAKHTPSITASRANGKTVNAQAIDVVQGILLYILGQANKDSFADQIYSDQLSGGFSVAKVVTEYESKMSFKQVAKIYKTFDATLCGFDPMARKPTKSDGRYSFEIIPFHAEDYLTKYKESTLDGIQFTKGFEGFNWSYKDAQNEKIILVADYYERKSKKVKIVELANEAVITEEKYEQLKAAWEKENFIEQFPVVTASRKADFDFMCRYILNEKEILKHEETDFSFLPHVFFPGKVIDLSDTNQGNITHKMTIPYFYHAQGIQNLKNFAGQTLAGCLESMIQSKWIVKKEAIPQEEDYREGILNVQKANTVIVNAFSENEPDKPIPDPIREVQNMPAPPEVMGTFTVTDQISQVILGSYDAALGINDNQLSGVALQDAATQTNAAAMPFVTGFMQGLTQVCYNLLDIIPKRYNKKRRVGIINKKGKDDYVDINTHADNDMNFEEGALNIEIKAGVSYEIQKNQALRQIIALMQASPIFAEFMNSEGLMILIKNLTIHGQENLEEAAENFLKKQEMKQQQAAKMQQEAMQNDPRVITAKAKMMDTQVKAMESKQKQGQTQIENQFKIAELANEKQHIDNETLLAEAEVTQSQVDSAVQFKKAQTELEVHALDAAAKLAGHHHEKQMDHHESIRKSIDLHHKLTNTQKEEKEHAEEK
jgi:hypothetical protein